MASNSTNKRRRRTAADILHISDLPIGFIADVSAYLTKPSKAILAVAFSAPSSSWRNDNLMHRQSSISKAIISASQWDTLDFEDVEKDLANKLTDDDIYAILKSINAHDVLKKFKLCGCTNIEGYGLSPLRGSAVLELLDISIVGKYEKQHIEPSGLKISTGVVISVLHSIISADGCSLKYILFPRSITKAEIRDPKLAEIRGRYNRLFDERGLSCTSCYTAIQGEGAHSSGWLSFYGYQNKMCYDCLKPFCDECAATDATDNEDSVLRWCNHCEKDYCYDCAPCATCVGCDQFACQGCSDRCDGCAKTWCKECPNMFRCILCKKTVCTKCSAYKESYMRECPADDFACEPCNERLW